MKRRIIVSGELRTRRTSAERIAHMHEDVTDLTNQLKRSITDKAHEFTVQGYALDDDSWEAAINGRTVVLSAVIERPE